MQRWISGVTAAVSATFLLLAATEVGAQNARPESAANNSGPFVNFETLPTKSVAFSPDGSRFFALNTPDGRLEIFDVANDGGLTAAGSVSVGMDPISLAVRPDGNQVWVVNHLSDSVSVVDVSANPPRVARTLLVGDEPRDIVFAGPNMGRAFVTAARRGQNHPDDVVNETQMPGIGRADVWVFDANNPGSGLQSQQSILTLFSDKPGAMTVSPDGRQVFVGVFTSGNKTTSISDRAVCGANGRGGLTSQFPAPATTSCTTLNGSQAFGQHEPLMSQTGVRGTTTGLIVQFDPQTGEWNDVGGLNRGQAVPFELPDNDVFVIDAMANPPSMMRAFTGVGTLNFNLVAHPTNGRVYMASINAFNLNRFLSVPALGAFPNPDRAGGAAQTADPVSGETLNGHLYESNIAVLQANGQADVVHLNSHIDYEVVPSPAGVKERSIANPQGLALSPDGDTLYVAALGSNKIATIPTRQLDNDNYTPSTDNFITLDGLGGPIDLTVSPTNPNLVYVYKRFDNSVVTVDVQARRQVSEVALFNPEPDVISTGRVAFYDANVGSSNGEANCNVCHPAADKDDLAWNLGTPFDGLKANPNGFIGGGLGQILNPFFNGFVSGITPTIEFNPLKGPMTVLTLRGIKDSGPMFWRGDASVATSGMLNAPAAGVNFEDARAAFMNSIPAVFPALLGRADFLPDADFANLAEWAMTLIPPPNPHAPLNGQLNPSQAAGRQIFTGGQRTDVIFGCNDCHRLDVSLGFFGTARRDVVEGENQFFKITQQRTVYDKVGMFGHTFGDNGVARTLGGPRTDVGPQIRGTGTLHDGSAAGAEEFLTAEVFQLNAAQLRQVVDFVYAFPNNVAPVVGQQITLRADSPAQVNARVDLLQQRAAATFVQPGNSNSRECDLVAKTVMGGREVGFVFQPGQNSYRSDTGQNVPAAQLRAMASGDNTVTFTCVYPGGGERIGIDRDADGNLDGMDNDLR